MKGHVYFDTSAWFKRYFTEKGSDRVLELMAGADKVCVSDAGIPELFSVLRRQVREGILSEAQYSTVKKTVGQDLKNCLVLPLDGATVSEATGCLERAILHGLDSIHVASARVHRCGLFVSADQRQCQAARTLGMKVVEV